MTDETKRLLDKLDHNLNDVLFDLVDENETLEGQVNELREQVARLTEKFGANCSSCILDQTDACSRGAGRAVDDEICEDYISVEQGVSE